MRALLLVPVLAGHLLAQQVTVIPTRYVADRFFAAPVTTNGDTLVMLIDTGGGQNFTTKGPLERLGFKLKFMSVEDGDSVFTGAKYPAFKPGAGIPVPIGSKDSSLFAIDGAAFAGMDATGLLGNTWLAGRVWVFDYPKHQLSFYESAPPAHEFGPHTIPMTLKNPPRTNHPRIRVVVAGDTIDMLLDTGATSPFSPDALALMGPGPRTRASAFAAARLFNAWVAAHPDWRVVPHGEAYESHADLIEVPSVTIAGFTTGPVWFAKRDNSVYDGMMKSLMDKPIAASIGGAAFKTFRITLDYPHQRVTFEQ